MTVVSAPAITLYQFADYQNSELELSVPSINPQCLAVHAYMKICQAPFKTVSINDDSASPLSRGLPVLAVNRKKTYAGIDDIVAFLSQKMGYILPGDTVLSEVEKFDEIAFRTLVEEKLFKFQLFNWWVEIENYETFTYHIFFAHKSFPLNIWASKQMRYKIISYLEHVGMTSKTKVYEDARKYYAVLAAKLGDKEFFFGDQPTTLDCIVFGFLMTQMVPKVPKDSLFQIICSHKKLVEFCEKIKTKYFSSENPSLLLNQKPLKENTKKKRRKTTKKKFKRGIKKKRMVFRNCSYF